MSVFFENSKLPKKKRWEALGVCVIRRHWFHSTNCWTRSVIKMRSFASLELPSSILVAWVWRFSKILDENLTKRVEDSHSVHLWGNLFCCRMFPGLICLFCCLELLVITDVDHCMCLLFIAVEIHVYNYSLRATMSGTSQIFQKPKDYKSYTPVN